MSLDSPAFVPPPYPHDRLGPIRATAAQVPGGILDASVGTPVDPMPAVVLDALAQAAPSEFASACAARPRRTRRELPSTRPPSAARRSARLPSGGSSVASAVR